MRPLPNGWMEELVRLRRDIHAHPELAFQETRTSDLLAAELARYGLEVDRGLAGTGIVATLRSGSSSRAIALRADMDALPVAELNDVAHASTKQGVMHACGHDGHSAMLLGAARRLAAHPDFDGTVHFVFQPAEENEGGGRVMVEGGLFERFPVDAVYGLHNWPGLAVGRIAVHPGPVMAAVDLFDITLSGRGAHAAMPHQGDDPIVAAGALITAIQTIVSRTTDPAEPVVLSVTRIEGGAASNIVPARVVLHGTCRHYGSTTSAVVEGRLRQLVEGTASTHGLSGTLAYDRRCPATINSPEPAARAIDAARATVGETAVDTDLPPSMGCEDFAHMLKVKQGCYVWLGNGPAENGRTLHSANYEFNDEILPIGVDYWVQLVRRCLPKAAA
ncbi:M20 aminoacylase family protein [Sphingomonas sp. RIT328]|uniref:M20 aminoacylase family protein n=1 Tax=Sphingomonas sp. RIT328 TaxID=1470591 RepID=UPI0004473C27|nr:M20 aminoacylase family protein [Sphingomonas sp. RIT328]EZP49983.1 Peptidase M20D, amidohydrolase [Sphingomonas sp. RIT328]